MLSLKEITAIVVPFTRGRGHAGKPTLTRKIDGRALYQYRISVTKLDQLERVLTSRTCSDFAKILILAPLAAGRFASKYDGGVRSWDDCGSAVFNLYRKNSHTFRELMALSLEHYKIPISTRDDSELLFETIIGQAGLPSAMLEQGNALRRLLDELIELAIQGQDLNASAVRLVEQYDGIPQAYKKANHLPKLCVDLVSAIDKLKHDSGWAGGALDAIWAINSWELRLPFLVEEHRAREIVGHLLNVAQKAAGAEVISIDRILCRVAGSWRLRAYASIPAEGIQLGGTDMPDVIALRYAIDNVPVDEACRLRRQTKTGTQYTIARVGQDLSEALAAPFRTISLCLPGDKAESVNCAGGEPLDAELPWVFEVRADGRFVYRDSAPQRLRCRELLVASPYGTIVTGNAELESGELAVHARTQSEPQRRQVWRVRGRAEFFTGVESPQVVEANYQGPQMHLGFSGVTADIPVPGCSAVFVGDPKPRRVGGLTGQIQWRISGTVEWRTDKISPVGKVNCRLTDDSGIALAERRICVLPEAFRCKVAEKSVELVLGCGFSVLGYPVGDGHRWTIDFGINLELPVTILAPSGHIHLTFAKPRPTAFKNIATGEQYHEGVHRISATKVGALVARSYVHERVLVQRKGAGLTDVREFLLQANELRLSNIKPFLGALAFSFRGRTSTITIAYPNHVALEIEAFRIKRNGNRVVIAGADPTMTIELHDLIPQGEPSTPCIPLERIDQDNWLIPPLSEGSQYLAIDASYQAAPCLVAGPSSALQTESRTFTGCVALSDESERLERLVNLYEFITADPGEPFSSAQFDICLDWFGRFAFVLPWVDPFLVLASRPELALKVLAVARVRNHLRAQRGLMSALDQVPLFWHALTPGMRARVLNWGASRFGAQGEVDVRTLILELGLSEKFERILGRGVQFFELMHDGLWHGAWQRRVMNWMADSEGFGTRPRPVAKMALALWKQVSNNEELRSLLDRRCNQVPHDIDDLHRTYLLAPFDLALAVALDIELEAALRDDLIYARFAIDVEQFDVSFCFAISLIELFK